MTIGKLFAVAAMIALLVAPTLSPAKGRGGAGRNATDTQTAAEKKARDAQLDKDYKSALDRIPDQKPGDPWGSIRPAADKAKSTN
jgi:uncharacterized protein YecT (DUF1311 family)